MSSRARTKPPLLLRLATGRIRRGWLLSALLLTAACAPSVPGSPPAPSHADAAGDARTDSRPAVPDGRSSLPDAGAREPAAADARGEAAPSAEGDIGGGGDAGEAPDAAIDDRAAGDSSLDIGSDSFTFDGAPPVLPRPGELVIDELLVNPAGTDGNREWIELLNTTTLALDLRTLHVADSSKEVAVNAGLLPPGALLLLGQSSDPLKNGGAPVALAYGGTISLNNDGDSIALCLGACAGGPILDRVAWASDLGPAYDGHAAVIASGGTAFCPAGTPFGTAGSFGTPGAPNPPCPAPDASTGAAPDASDAASDASSDAASTSPPDAPSDASSNASPDGAAD